MSKDPPRYHGCAAKGCASPVRIYSRYCAKHAQNYYRTGDPTGRTFRDHQLRPYRVLIEEYLDREAMHPAVVCAHEWMDGLLNSRYKASAHRRHMDRLRGEGATPRELLVAALSVFAYEEAFSVDHLRPASDRCVTMNIGRAVMKVRKLPHRIDGYGRPRTKAPPAKTCVHLGQMIREGLGAFSLTFIRFINAEVHASRRSAQMIHKALETPFGSTPTPSQVQQPAPARPIVDELAELDLDAAE